MEIEITEEELNVVLNDVLEAHGYDFTSYARASLTRRINRLILIDKFPSFAEFRYRVKNDIFYLKRFVEEITVNVTEMFRDPAFYKALREQIIPAIATKPFIRIWHAGCASGEEVYSMAILMKQANLLHKTLIYATDINPEVVAKAKKGIYPANIIAPALENYSQIGAVHDLSAYYTTKYDHIIFAEELKKKIVFATHNLVSDSSFNEFQLILCRNVLIYFDKDLQNNVFRLFDQSLEPLGYLALGAKETLRFSGIISRYRQLQKERIWCKTQ